MKDIVRYSEVFVISRFVKSMFHCASFDIFEEGYFQDLDTQYFDFGLNIQNIFQENAPKAINVFTQHNIKSVLQN